MLLLPRPLKHVLQAGGNLRFHKSRVQIPPLRSRMREKCCLATKQIVYCISYDCQGPKLTINIFWVVNCQIHFPQSKSFHAKWWFAKKMLSDVTGNWQLLGKLKEQPVVRRWGCRATNSKYTERLELTCQSS